jgi:hypothetical protein
MRTLLMSSHRLFWGWITRLAIYFCRNDNKCVTFDLCFHLVHQLHISDSFLQKVVETRGIVIEIWNIGGVCNLILPIHQFSQFCDRVWTRVLSGCSNGNNCCLAGFYFAQALIVDIAVN